MPGHISADDMTPVLVDLVFGARAVAYVCGSARFADAASRVLVEAGVPVERIRVERFGPTG
jgi:ferredoxin-NADP reductase